jgi:kumamolisin
MKIILCASWLALAVLSNAQTAPDIIVPSSTKPHTTNGQRAFHSDYLIYKGAWDRLHKLGPRYGSFDRRGIPREIGGYYPSDILSAYDIPAGEGTEAIAVIDAYDLPTNLSDFNTFSQEFGLPQETSTDPTSSSNKVFQVVYPQGSQPTSNTGWNGEIALDMEWAHALAPKAKIYLVECATDHVNDLLGGVQYAAQNLPNLRVVSMSFGASEYSGETQFDSIFKQPGVTFLAAAGDVPNVATYPATSSYVVSVGGTTLELSAGIVESEVYWYQNKSEGGSAGPSTIEPRPVYQNPFASIIGAYKGNPDVAADGNPNTGCAVYVSSPVAGVGNQNVMGWLVIGGTSLACPIVSGIVNDRGNFQPSSYDELSLLYSLEGTDLFRQIVSGTSGVYSAAPGYNLVCGLGAPLGIYQTSIPSFQSGFLFAGVPISGVPDNMAIEDDHVYEVRSAPSGQNTLVSIGASFNGTVAGSAARSGTIVVSGLSTAVLTQVSALNVSTGQYDILGSIPLTYVKSTVSLSTSAIGNYLSSSGQIVVRITGTNTHSTIPCELSIDRAAVSVEGPIG